MNQRTESTWDVLMKTAVMRYRKEGQGVITRGGANEPPFSAPWHDWRPDTQWPVPTLPSGAPFVEMAAAGVDNGWALQALCSHWGIAPSEVTAFGDMPNDVPMLRWAGYSVAVANAHLDVRQQVQEVTLSNNDDGVAVVLDRLLSCRRVDA